MNLKTLSLSLVAAVAALVGSHSASAQFSSSGTGFNVGVAGGYSKTTLPNGQTIKNSNLNWGVGVGGAYTNSTLPYGGGYGGWGYAPAVMPWGGGGCYPTPYYGGAYSPFTNTVGVGYYRPAILPYRPVPAACLPQVPVCW